MILVPITQLYCTGCHNNTNPLGGLSLQGYNNIATVANDGRLLGVLRWEPGFPKMPRNGNQLSDCIIREIEIWIENGTPNN